jgi:two-component system LytT family sensor kinase
MPIVPVSHTESTTPSRVRVPMIAILAVWTLWGVWSLQQGTLAAILGGRVPVARANPWQLTIISAWAWALMTPAVIWNARRIRDHVRSAPRRVLVHLGSFGLLHLFDIMVYRVAADILAPSPRPLLPMLFSMVTFNALAYTTISFMTTSLDAGHALRERITREARLETQLALAQFHALRAQLHPHFLFNALNAISSLIHSDPTRADRMLSRISELLRLAIDTSARPEVALDEELEFARRYLEVERMRYGERLDVRIDVRDGMGHALVPNMLLQPLLENAVRHGVAPHARPGRVEVRADRAGDRLSIVVGDTGAGFDAESPDGVGLKATRQRLEKLYGADQRLEFASVPAGFEARVSLPFRSSPPAAVA